MSGKTVFITGATSGIGLACAWKFAYENYRLILCGRREERLMKISEEIVKDTGTEVLALTLDVRNKEDVYQKIQDLPEDWQKIDLLINNAGLARGMTRIFEGVEQDWEEMIETNIKGLLYVSKAVIKDMINRKSGQIINIGSIAGKQTYDKGNVYCATKHAVESLTEAMRMELLPYSIKVTLLNPGAVNTEFSEVRYRGDKKMAERVYDGFQPLKAEDIANCALFCAQLPDHVNINDMLVMPTSQANAILFNKKFT